MRNGARTNGPENTRFPVCGTTENLVLSIVMYGPSAGSSSMGGGGGGGGGGMGDRGGGPPKERHMTVTFLACFLLSF